MRKTYTIGGRKFRTGKLVMGQVLQLAEYLAQADIDLSDIDDVKSLIVKNLRHLPRIFAIILVPEDKGLRDRNLDEEEAFLYAHLEFSDMVEILSDFFATHRIGELVEEIVQLIETITGQLETSEASERK